MDASWRPWWTRWRWPLLLSLGLHAALFWPQALRESGGSAASARLRAKLHMPAITPPTMVPPTAPDAVATRVRRPVQTQAMPTPPQASAVAAAPVFMQASMGLDVGGVRAYRIALARVPALAALQLGALPQGELELGIAVDTATVGLIRGSGDARLDETVLSAVRAAVREADVPAILRGTGGVVSLRIRTGD